jgi:hypothetical protein
MPISETGKPIIAVALTEGGLRLAETSHGRVLILSSPEEAVSILGHLSKYGEYLRNKLEG